MLQRLSRESLRVNSPQDTNPRPQVIYETSRQVKKAYNKRKGPHISETERRRIDRLRVLDERAEKIRQKEQRKKENALKRKAKEEKEGPRKLTRITSSQPELSKFFVSKKGVSAAVVKGEQGYPTDHARVAAQAANEAESERLATREIPATDDEGEDDVVNEASALRDENEDPASDAHEISALEDEDAQSISHEVSALEEGDAQSIEWEAASEEEALAEEAAPPMEIPDPSVKKCINKFTHGLQKSEPLAERAICGNMTPNSPTLVGEYHDTSFGENWEENLILSQRLTMKLCSGLSIPVKQVEAEVKAPQIVRSLTEDITGSPQGLNSIIRDRHEVPGAPSVSSKHRESAVPPVIPQSSPPEPIYANIPLSEGNSEAQLFSDWDENFLTPQTLAKLDKIDEEAEAAVTKREEDERILEMLRGETDYNDYDDNYELEDDPRFDYDYEDEPTSPVNEVDEDAYGDDDAYGMGLSDPAFDELQDAFEPEAEEMGSSFLCQAFDDDLRELEDEF